MKPSPTASTPERPDAPGETRDRPAVQPAGGDHARADLLLAILDDLSDGVLAFDHEGRCRYLNREARRVLGPEAEGEADALGPGVAVLREAARRAMAADEPVEVAAFATSRGRWYEARACPSRPGAVVVLRDATQQRLGSKAATAARAGRRAGDRGLGGARPVHRLEDLPDGRRQAQAPGGGRSEPERGAGHDGPHSPEPAEKPRRRIMVVDDNLDSAETMAELVRIWGYDVRTAHDGPAAIDTARGFRPHVVLLDVGLPGMDGYELARRLRAEGLAGDLLVSVTGYGQEDDRRRAEEAGFDHHLTKPVDPDTLQRLVSQA
jgi:CheY-like chemotaxis protein